MWEIYYKYWASQRGTPRQVRKLKFLGLRGWHGHIQKKIVDDIAYAGEVYDCITPEGERINAIFRIPFDQVNTSYDSNYEENDEVIKEITNYHTDGILAWQTGNFRNYDNRQLKRREKILKNKIIILKNVFTELNNIDHAELKLAIQLYLRRLETPDHYTSKDWANVDQKLKNEILNLWKKYEKVND